MRVASRSSSCRRSQKLRMLLTHRKLLQSKAIAIENDLRATLRNFGLKVGVDGQV
jgi:transposase